MSSTAAASGGRNSDEAIFFLERALQGLNSGQGLGFKVPGGMVIYKRFLRVDTTAST